MLLDLVTPNQSCTEVLEGSLDSNGDLPVLVISGKVISGKEAGSSVQNVARNGAGDFRSESLMQAQSKTGISKVMPAKYAPELVCPSGTSGLRTNAFGAVSAQMRAIHAQVGRIAWSEAPVLIQGETGSGKEVLARELHAQSPRDGKPFLKVNCAALPSELVESELFGFERGAFTGAFQKKMGMFELADGGTILLDEIGDMDIKLQAKLLQVLQDKEFQRIGGKQTIRVDVRIMAATHRDLEKAIINREFRQDLYYRLNVITLHLPRLSERKEDILPLTEFLIRKHSTEVPLLQITPELKHAFMSYDWPGNIRELENVVRKLLILRNPGGIIAELSRNTTRTRPSTGETTVAQTNALPAIETKECSPVLEQFTQAKQQAESEAILTALDSTRWNRKQAAALLKIDYKALLYKMKKLGM